MRVGLVIGLTAKVVERQIAGRGHEIGLGIGDLSGLCSTELGEGVLGDVFRRDAGAEAAEEAHKTRGFLFEEVGPVESGAHGGLSLARRAASSSMRERGQDSISPVR